MYLKKKITTNDDVGNKVEKRDSSCLKHTAGRNVKKPILRLRLKPGCPKYQIGWLTATLQKSVCLKSASAVTLY
jgi:hypothetical protein